MNRFGGFTLALAGMLMATAACSDDPTSAPGEPEEPEPPVLAALIVSEPVAQVTTSGSATAYVSLPFGSLPGHESVRIRNVTANGSLGEPVALSDGGFDPVAVAAGTGDRLELHFRLAGGAEVRRGASVPDRRAPVVLRTSPVEGEPSVAPTVTPTVVFSEPIDPASFDGVRVWKGGMRQPGAVVPEDGRPWQVRLTLSAPMEPGAYALEVTRSVRDLAGDRPDVPTTAVFSTTPAVELDSFERTLPEAGITTERFVLHPHPLFVWQVEHATLGPREHTGTYGRTADGGIAFHFHLESAAGSMGGTGTLTDDECVEVSFNFLANDWGFVDGIFCRPGADPRVQALQTLTGLVVSDPTGGIAYVSLRPRSVPPGSRAAIATRDSGAEIALELLAGGFDPVAVEAASGDTLKVRIELSSGEVEHYVAEVPERLPPVVVRTDPPDLARDVPTDVAPRIVFSEPIDVGSLTWEAIQIVRDDQAETKFWGTTQLTGDGLVATFTPNASLTPGWAHFLEVGPEPRDRNGDSFMGPGRTTFEIKDALLTVVSEWERISPHSSSDLQTRYVFGDDDRFELREEVAGGTARVYRGLVHMGDGILNPDPNDPPYDLGFEFDLDWGLPTLAHGIPHGDELTITYNFAMGEGGFEGGVYRLVR